MGTMTRLTQCKERLVLVGNGMAGMRTIEEILACAPDRFSISVIGNEPRPNYNRILLSSLLAGERRFEEIILNGPEWYARHGIDVVTGEAVVDVDRANRVVIGARGTRRPYDVLLIATGSTPHIPAIPGYDLPGVTTFRSMADVEAMAAATAEFERAVVIGGGLLGLEAAYGLRRRGMAVVVMHLMQSLMERQLDAAAGDMLRQDLERRGIRIVTAARTEKILGDRRVRGVVLSDGREFPADLVVIATGIVPHAELGKAIGLDCKRGILVDDTLQTSDPAIFAIGECAEHRGVTHGLLAPIWEMAQVCAQRIAGTGARRFNDPVAGTRLKVTGLDIFSAGDFLGDDTTDDLTFRDVSRGVYKRLVVKGECLVGAVLYGDTRDSDWFLGLIRNGAAIGAIRHRMIFGKAYAAAGALP